MEQGEKILTSCDHGGPLTIHIKDGRIIRIRPLVFGNPEQAQGLHLRETQGLKRSS